jgi:hypothetical protein
MHKFLTVTRSKIKCNSSISVKEQPKGQQKCLKKRKLSREKVRSSLKGIWQIELKWYQPLKVPSGQIGSA